MSVSDYKKELAKLVGDNDGDTPVKHWISTGYEPLNLALSGQLDGGFGCGRLYEMYGESSSGKTLMATMAMINAQKAGGVAMFIDYERSFDHGMAAKVGLDLTAGTKWIYKKPETWEEGNSMAVKAAILIRQHKIIPADAPIIIVQDSIASAVPQSVFAKGEDFGELNMNDTSALARVTSTTLKSMSSYAEKYDFCALYLNQVREKIGVVYGDSTATPGGKSMEFFASGRIQLSRKKVLVDDGAGGKRMDHQVITAKVVKTKHTRPFQQSTYRIGFDEQNLPYLDEVNSYIELGKAKKMFTSPRIEWEGKKYTQAQMADRIIKNNEVDALKAFVLGDKKPDEPKPEDALRAIENL